MIMIMKLKLKLKLQITFFIVALAISLFFDERITTAAAPFNASLGTYLPPPGDSNQNVLQSPNLMFTLTIKPWIDSSSYYCMAAVMNSKLDPGSMVWSASYDSLPISTQSCSLYFSPQGDLLLQDNDRNTTVWQTHTSGMGVTSLTLRDSGNLVLTNAQGFIVWQSFQQTPIFQFYAGQNFTTNTTLWTRSQFSSNSPDFGVPGSVGLRFDDIYQRLVLFVRESGYVYWSTTFAMSDTSSSNVSLYQYVRLEQSGFILYDGEHSHTLGSIRLNAASNAIVNVAYVGAITSDLYAFHWTNTSWALNYNSSMHPCQAPQTCGDYGLCNKDPGTCTCPQGFVTKTGGKGCMPLRTITGSSNSSTDGCTEAADKYEYVSVNVSFEPQIPAVISPSPKDCASMCLTNCSCNVALYDPPSGSCSFFPIVHTMLTSVNSSQLMLLKVAAIQESKMKLGVIVGCLMAGIICLGFIIASYIWWRRKRSKGAAHNDDEMFLQAIPRLPPRYTYKELEVATKGFDVKLGSGGFGAVYEGTDSSGAKIAVKKLEIMTGQSSVQVRAEVATIGSISHMNLVTLKGFCIEGDHKLLVYEYMANGSLDRWLFNGSTRCNGSFSDGHTLSWEQRWRIAIDTARGLAYLHDELDESIVHCDVKPENILLDERFHAKVADFGLAKLLPGGHEPKQSFAITTLKGTRGYIGPEWIQEATITSKSDVYSYGVVLLELLSGRRSMDSDYGSLPDMAFRLANTTTNSATATAATLKMVPEEQLDGTIKLPVQLSIVDSGYTAPELEGSERVHKIVVGLLDEALHINYHDMIENSEVLCKGQIERMVVTAMWCVQAQPTMRPSMSSVMQMLEGVVDISLPPVSLQFDFAAYTSLFLNATSSNYEDATKKGPSFTPGSVNIPPCLSGR